MFNDDKDRKLCIICSKGTLDMAYPGLVLANAALMEGIDVRHGETVATAGGPPPTLCALFHGVQGKGGTLGGELGPPRTLELQRHADHVAVELHGAIHVGDFKNDVVDLHGSSGVGRQS